MDNKVHMSEVGGSFIVRCSMGVQVELHGLLFYLVNKMKYGDEGGAEMVVLQELIEHMGGVGFTEDLSDEQLQGLSGGDAAPAGIQPGKRPKQIDPPVDGAPSRRPSAQGGWSEHRRPAGTPKGELDRRGFALTRYRLSS